MNSITPSISKSKLTLLSILLLTTTPVMATAPTQAQIEQFQSLPPAQQEMLAKQMGVDLTAIVDSERAQNQSTAVTEAPKAKRATELQEPQEKSEGHENELPFFGYDVFAGEALDFTPIDNLPVPIDYQIAPGDEIRVQLFGKTYHDYKLKVDRDGKINIPKFGPEYVAGQTFGELKLYIDSLIKRKAIGVDAVVSLSEIRTMQVFITGDVSKPGAYNVNGLTSLSQALIASGGIKKTGSLRNIQVKRMGNTVARFDAYDMLIEGNSSNDVRLQAGDTIFVPLKKLSATIRGEVRRPAHYELKGTTTIDDLLNISGGPVATASLSKVNIQRRSPQGIKQLTIDLASDKSRKFRIQAGDEVTLFPASLEIKNAIALRGEFVNQGAFEFKANSRITDVIRKKDLKENADLNYGLIVRETNVHRDVEILQFNLAKALQEPESSSNLKLRKSDQIFIFDNGLDLEYWYRKREANKKSVSESLGLKGVEVLDEDTGALIVTEQEKRLSTANTDSYAIADNIRLSSREVLLKPIIERLKAQAALKKSARIVEISGAVKFPGVYPLANNATFSQVIEAAGGFSEQAYLYSAELSRTEKTKHEFAVKHFNFSPQDVLLGTEVLSIAPLDHLIIKTQPYWQRDYAIELQGEVVFPGTYTFQRGETLQDVIERAGGLTKYAYPQGAVFSRESLKRQEEERLKLLNLQLKQEISNLALRRQSSSARYTTSPSEALSIADALASTKAMGRLVINLPQALAGNKSSDLMLEKGDKLYIPAKQPIISVIGEVQFASNHTYQPGMSIEEYVQSAGGTKKQADTDRVYIVRADGSVMLPNSSFWFSRKSQPLEPGDTIIVPLDTDYLDGLSTLTSATQILYQIGVAWSAVKN